MSKGKLELLRQRQKEQQEKKAAEDAAQGGEAQGSAEVTSETGAKTEGVSAKGAKTRMTEEEVNNLLDTKFSEYKATIDDLVEKIKEQAGQLVSLKEQEAQLKQELEEKIEKQEEELASLKEQEAQHNLELEGKIQEQEGQLVSLKEQEAQHNLELEEKITANNNKLSYLKEQEAQLKQELEEKIEMISNNLESFTEERITKDEANESNIEAIRSILTAVDVRINDSVNRLDESASRLDQHEAKTTCVAHNLAMQLEEFRNKANDLSAVQNNAIKKLILAVKSLEEDQANFAVDILLLEVDQTEEEEMSNREFLRSDAISKLKALLGEEVLDLYKVFEEGSNSEQAESNNLSFDENELLPSSESDEVESIGSQDEDVE